MTLTSVHKDPTALTMTFTAEFEAPIERAWQLWANPRKLERWFGPPTFPATFVEHDLRPGGSASYFMTGPEGEQPRGWWRVIAVEAPTYLEFEDGFADEDGNRNLAMPTMLIRISLSERAGGGTRMTIATAFKSLEQMDQLMALGMEEGFKEAIGQADALLA